MAEAVPIVWALAEVTESEECVLQILKHLKMEHLSQCASACRLWSLLAFETQQRIPSWSSRMSFLPHVVGVLDPERVSEQIRKTVRDARSQLVGPPDLCFVFVGSMVAPCYLEALADNLPFLTQVLGCSAPTGVVGLGRNDGDEKTFLPLESQPDDGPLAGVSLLSDHPGGNQGHPDYAFSLSLASLPSASIHVKCLDINTAISTARGHRDSSSTGAQGPGIFPESPDGTPWRGFSVLAAPAHNLVQPRCVSCS